ncbi:MAG: hypothetical protein A3F68_07735 [Acidobacteria bacterium RIFCSPLOWO2_12_FULL_54_10]|nr:MAG: hypothetical protein A3F68_07735 [Acidobacteria bacterium RIFCSPLOWO2_12_FULL_54_10]
MKIAIDIRRIDDFGVGTYIRNLVPALLAQDRTNDYLLLGDPQKAQAITEAFENSEAMEWAPRKDSWWSQLRLQNLLESSGADLLHIPHLKAVHSIRFPYVITVHDLADYLFGTAGGMRRSLQWKTARRSLQRARTILAVSKATKREIENLFDIPSDKIAVVENALDARFLEKSRQEEKRLVLERYGVHDPYLLYVGSARPQKNIPRLIEAFAVVKGELRDHPVYGKLKLLIIGDELSEQSDLRRTVIRTRTQNDVRFLGFVPVETLRVFYQAAEVFVFPSLHEGFGLPPLEAMSQGTPVVTSNVSSLPDVVGEAAVLVYPENIFDIARGIEQVLLDEQLQEQLREAGTRQIKRYSWSRSAKQILEIYQEAAA